MSIFDIKVVKPGALGRSQNFVRQVGHYMNLLFYIDGYAFKYLFLTIYF